MDAIQVPRAAVRIPFLVALSVAIGASVPPSIEDPRLESRLVGRPSGRFCEDGSTLSSIPTEGKQEDAHAGPVVDKGLSMEFVKRLHKFGLWHPEVAGQPPEWAGTSQ
jgi:hypothetical protein